MAGLQVEILTPKRQIFSGEAKEVRAPGWEGDWNVTDPTGKVAGTNLVTREEAGCLIHEHWSGGGGATANRSTGTLSAPAKALRVSADMTPSSARCTVRDATLAASARCSWVHAFRSRYCFSF